MSSRLDSTSAILGEYMLKGWTLTDLACDRCHSTPLMREPPAEAQRAGRAPIQFCASCDGGPEGVARHDRRLSSTSTSGSSAYYETAASLSSSEESTNHLGVDLYPSTPGTVTASPPRTPRRAPPQRRTPPTSPPASHAASARGDPDAAADAISALLLRGYSLLSSTCPEPTCRGVPLVGFPRRKDGARDPRRECVSCGKRWVDEKDLANSGLRPQTASSASVTGASNTPTRRATPSRTVTPAPESESPRSKARRELYEQGNAIMAERARAAEMKKAEEDALAAAGLLSSGSSLAPAASSSARPAEDKGKGKGRAVPSIRRKPFAAEDHMPLKTDGKLRVVVISTGSVASIKIPNILEALGHDANVEVQVVATNSSLHFYNREELESEHEGVGVWTDSDEWSDWKAIGDPILHIELRRWADLVVIAPCSADMLAKIAVGICDNLALSMLRALEPDTPVIICPAMNTYMFSHPLTERHTEYVKQVLGYHILGPQGGKKLACGDIGAGKMTEWTDIVSIIRGYAAITRNRTGSKKVMNAKLRALLAETEENDDDDENDVFMTPKQPKQSTTSGSLMKRFAQSSLAPTIRKAEHVVTHPPTDKVRAIVRWPFVTFAALLAAVLNTLRGSLFMPVLHVLSFALSALHRALLTPLAFFRFVLSPFLILLHIGFTLSSIALRMVQSRPKTPPEVTKAPPEHLALILVAGDGVPQQVIAERYVESVRRAILWAAEWGVRTLSVWDRDGLGVRFHAAVTQSLLNLPPSPPSSSPSSPPQEPVPDVAEHTISASVYVNSPTGPRRVEVYFLAPSASDTIARVTRKLSSEGVDPAEVDEAELDRAIKADLDLPSDPQLVIIHSLAPPGFLRGLLPRPAPELHGYPAWLLRITEIYAHPPRLPLYVPFLGTLLQNSKLPVIRKLGAPFPSSVGTGVLDTDEWEGAQAAWESVDQRRGK